METISKPEIEAWKTYDILIVDDEPSVLNKLHRELSLSGFSVTPAASAEEGLALLKTLPAKVIISDQKMPSGMSGTEFLCEVRKQYPDVITMILSGFSEPKYILGAMNDAKALFYILKPWNKSDLISRVTQALTTYHRKITEAARVAHLESLLDRAQAMIEKTSEIGARAGGMAHNIRNMLFPMMAQMDNVRFIVQELQQKLESVPDLARHEHVLKESFKEIVDDVDHSEANIGNIVDFIESAMVSFRGQKKEPETFDLLKLIEHDIALERKQERFKHIQVHLQTHGENFNVKALKGYLSSNLVELLKNAADAILEKNKDGIGNIWISLEAVRYDHFGEGIRLVIRDDGIGMSEETRARIFEPDFTTKATGTGKGLPELTALLADHGGTVDVESQLGQGTTFTIVLPKGV